MSQKNKGVIYICEGNTDQRLLKTLQKHFSLRNGKVQIFNLWEKNFNSLFRKISPDKINTICIVFDTDRLCQLNRFEQNVLQAKKAFTNVYLLAQQSNFEEELVHSCQKPSKRQLFLDMYDCSSDSEFKSCLLKDKKLNDTLIGNNFNIDLYCSRKDIYQSILNSNNFNEGEKLTYGIFNLLS